jgi:hypothetical protein
MKEFGGVTLRLIIMLQNCILKEEPQRQISLLWQAGDQNTRGNIHSFVIFIFLLSAYFSQEEGVELQCRKYYSKLKLYIKNNSMV